MASNIADSIWDVAFDAKNLTLRQECMSLPDGTFPNLQQLSCQRVRSFGSFYDIHRSGLPRCKTGNVSGYILAILFIFLSKTLAQAWLF